MCDELKPCHSCGATRGLYILWKEDTPYVFCDNCKTSVINECCNTEQEAIEAWNTRDWFEAPDGYIVLPAAALEEPKPVIRDTGYGVEAMYDASDIIRRCSEYLAEKACHEIVTRSLNRAGWFKKSTCTMEWHCSDSGGSAYTCSNCGMDVYPFNRKFEHCPYCTAKVVEYMNIERFSAFDRLSDIYMARIDYLFNELATIYVWNSVLTVFVIGMLIFMVVG